MNNSPGSLMNYPDAFGQYYHPTPTPAAMGLGQNSYNTWTGPKYSHTNTPIVVGTPESNNYDRGPWTQSNYYNLSLIHI